jgi:hypothetical protein
MTAEFLPVVGGNIGPFDIFFERSQMKTALAEKQHRQESRRGSVIEFSGSESIVVVRRGDVEAMRRRMTAAIERMHADTRPGDAAKFLREFRENPRAR